MMSGKILSGLTILVLAANLIACNNEDKTPEPAVTETRAASIKEETVSYQGDSVTMKGFIAYDENKEGPRPAILIIHEWWGLTDYTKRRARQLADLGYIAFAVDLYGDGKTADNPDSATKYSTPFYSNPQKAKARFDAALAKLKTYAQADTTRIAGIGYCFGGSTILNLARMGENLKGVVSFHGNLLGVPLDKSKLKAEMLICHGAADPFVSPKELEDFKKQMAADNIKYEFHSYEGALHAFTNPDATALGEKFKLPIKYNEAADTASWKDMKAFFARVL